MFHAAVAVAVAVAKPGDVIVVDSKADNTCALFGDLMVTQGAAAKLGGFVVDAASRDTPSWLWATSRSSRLAPPCGPPRACRACTSPSRWAAWR